MGLLWSLIIGAVIGAIAGAITGKGNSMGWIANIVAGLGISTIYYWCDHLSFDCFIFLRPLKAIGGTRC